MSGLSSSAYISSAPLDATTLNAPEALATEGHEIFGAGNGKMQLPTVLASCCRMLVLALLVRPCEMRGSRRAPAGGVDGSRQGLQTEVGGCFALMRLLSSGGARCSVWQRGATCRRVV
jgi:hypothetical protein